MKNFYCLILIILISLLGCDKKVEKIEQLETVEKTYQNKKIEKTKPKKDKLVTGKYKHIKKIHTRKEINGIYLTTYTLVGEGFEEIIEKADSAGVNTVIFDVKNMKGELFLPTAQKSILGEENIHISLDIAATVKTLHKRDMKAVARVVMFHNQYLAEKYPEYRPGNIDGGEWLESKRRKPSWLDPSNVDVQNRLYKLIEFVCDNGIDEIQMDYIRFPTQGDLDRAEFDFQIENRIKAEKDSTYIEIKKEDIITDVVKKVKKICEKYDVTLAADIFAITAWQQERDVANTGQNIGRLSDYLDYMHPMIYSSHFAENFGYRENIYNEPYLIVYWATHLTRVSAHKDCKIVPYIQANDWKVNYKREYMLAQIEGAKDGGGDGYLLWNSSSRYFNALKWVKEK